MTDAAGAVVRRAWAFVPLVLLVALDARASDLVLVGGTVYPAPDSQPIRDAPSLCTTA